MRSSVLTILFLLVVVVFQSCDTKLNVDNNDDFFKYIGEDGNQWGVDMLTDADGNIFILGKTSSATNGTQVYVVKTNSSGNVQWTNSFGSTADEDPKDLEMTTDGNLVVVADRIETGGDSDFMIYKVNSSDGTVIGTALRVGSGSTPDHVNSITQTNDGFVVASFADSSSYKSGHVFRYYNDLTPYPNSWVSLVAQEDGASGYDVVPMKVIQFDANNFFTFGYTNTQNGDGVNDYNFFVSAGNQYNDNLRGLLIIPGPDANSDERLTSVTRMSPESGSGFVMSGYISYPGAGQDLYVLRTPLFINLALGYNKPSASPSDPDLPNLRTYLTGDPKVVTTNLSTINSSRGSVFSSAASGFLLLGQENLSGNDNLFLTKVDKDLADAWSDPHKSHVFGGIGNDLAGAVIETSNGRILVLGTMTVGEVNGQTKIVLMNLSPNGLFGE